MNMFKVVLCEPYNSHSNIYFEYIVESVNELEAIHKLRTAENATGEVHEITELKPNNGIIFVRCHHT